MRAMLGYDGLNGGHPGEWKGAVSVYFGWRLVCEELDV